MNLKPAGIKTTREAIERLMNGEVFYSPNGNKIIYDDTDVQCSTGRSNPFKVRCNAGSEPINGLWEKVFDWQTKCKWEDDIGEGVLCWASDSNVVPNNSDRAQLIVKYSVGDKYPYETNDKHWYAYATPLTQKELKRYSRG